MTKLTGLVAGIGMLLTAVTASAHEIKHKSLEIIHPWTPAAADQSERDAAVDMRIRNLGKMPDRLLSTSSARASKAQLQSSIGATMRPVDAIELKPGAEFAMTTRGTHIMMFGLAKPLFAYDSFPITQVFENAGSIDVEVMVEELETEPRKPS